MLIFRKRGAFFIIFHSRSSKFKGKKSKNVWCYTISMAWDGVFGLVPIYACPNGSKHHAYLFAYVHAVVVGTMTTYESYTIIKMHRERWQIFELKLKWFVAYATDWIGIKMNKHKNSINMEQWSNTETETWSQWQARSTHINIITRTHISQNGLLTSIMVKIALLLPFPHHTNAKWYFSLFFFVCYDVNDLIFSPWINNTQSAICQTTV